MTKLTPMMQQYFQIKDQHKNSLLFFRLGDFYELFFEDAVTASKELSITLTKRDAVSNAPMCGVPYHSADSYISKLVEKGYTVAVCEQMEDASKVVGKNIVKREVIRIITPGTLTDTNSLDDTKNNYIMSIFEDEDSYGIAYADVTTGVFYTSEIKKLKKGSLKKIIDEIARLIPKEIIVNINFTGDDEVFQVFNIKVNKYYSWIFEYENCYKAITNHLKILDLSGIGLVDKKLSITAGGALIEYLHQTQKNSLSHIREIKIYNYDKHMFLDISSRKNLELTENIREKNKKGSLLWVLDKTKTSMGARLLRNWLEEPLIIKEDIKKRNDAVEDYKDDIILREEVKHILNEIYDIERLMSKIIYKNANGKDLNSLKMSFEYLPNLKNIIMDCKGNLNKEIVSSFDDLSDIYDLINRSINSEAPVNIKDGYLIKDGYNQELDKYRDIKNNSRKWLKKLEERERELTGIKNLKITYNKVFGYCIEVTNSYKNLVPEGRFIRKQTLSNCERYITEELKKIEEEILQADENILELETKLFIEIREQITYNVERINLTAYMISVIDVLQSFGEVADENNYVKPVLNAKGEINIVNGRHPVVEKMIKDEFVPNNTTLNTTGDKLQIITGPNMAGKSTYMRQVALIVLMAHIGSFVPAESANISIVDRIFTRVGASDDLATGQSTFMVEMSEVSNILNNATKKSLLILDEIGRGTGTFDGLSIAWAVLEHIVTKIGAKTLFATHYHELTELQPGLEGVKNYCMAVRNVNNEVIFLKKLVKGVASSSYGTYIARLAGLPQGVVNRSEELFNMLSTTVKLRDLSFINKENRIVKYGKAPRGKNENNKIIIEESEETEDDIITAKDVFRKLVNQNYQK